MSFRVNLTFLILILIWISACNPTEGTTDQKIYVDPFEGKYVNPVLNESGDPFCLQDSDSYYLYLPIPVEGNNGGTVQCWQSQNLVDWEDLGVVYSNVGEAYGGDRAMGLWAPEVLKYNGAYYLYCVNVMSNGISEAGNKDIVVVKSDRPTSFNRSDRTVLLDDDFALIDPSPFVDGDKLYLYYKSRTNEGGSKLLVHSMGNPEALAGDPTELFHSSDLPNAVGILEHPHCFRELESYFLFFSSGQGKDVTYKVNYATAENPSGPFTYRGILMESDNELSGDLRTKNISPGGSSIVFDGNGQKWMVYRQKTTTDLTFADRATCITALNIDPSINQAEAENTFNKLRDLPAPLK